MAPIKTKSADAKLITTTVRKLRKALGDTQQSMAERLGIAIATMVRYESIRAPRGRALKQFEELALAHKFQAYADVFAHALALELGGTPSPMPTGSSSGEWLAAFAVSNLSPEETTLHSALQRAIRDPTYAKVIEKVRKTLAPIAAEIELKIEEQQILNDQGHAAMKLIADGKSDAEILAKVNLPPTSLELLRIAHAHAARQHADGRKVETILSSWDKSK